MFISITPKFLTNTSNHTMVRLSNTCVIQILNQASRICVYLYTCPK